MMKIDSVLFDQCGREFKARIDSFDYELIVVTEDECEGECAGECECEGQYWDGLEVEPGMVVVVSADANYALYKTLEIWEGEVADEYSFLYEMKEGEYYYDVPDWLDELYCKMLAQYSDLVEKGDLM